jgi:hypothetical protein
VESALRAEEAEAAKNRYRRLTWIALTMMAVALIAAILAGVLWNTENANYAMASKYATIAAIERDALATSNESSGVALAKFIAAYEQAIDSQATANAALATSDANPLEQANAEMAATSAAVAQSTASAFRTSANATSLKAIVMGFCRPSSAQMGSGS